MPGTAASKIEEQVINLHDLIQVFLKPLSDLQAEQTDAPFTPSFYILQLTFGSNTSSWL